MDEISAFEQYDDNLAISLRNRQESPLLRLPAELRNEIFVYVLGNKSIHVNLVQEDHMNTSKLIRLMKPASTICSLSTDPRTGVSDSSLPIRARQHNQAQTGGRPSHTFAILEVCKLLNAETRLLPFSLNEFHFFSGATMGMWMDAVGPRCTVVRTVSICTYIAWGNSICWNDRVTARLREIVALRTVEVVAVVMGARPPEAMEKLEKVLEDGLKERIGLALKVSSRGTS